MGRLVHPRHLSVLHVRTGAAHLIQPEQDPALNLLGIPAARALHQDPERQRSVEPSPDVFEHSTTRPTRPVLRSTKYRVREKTFTRRGFKDPFFIRDGPHLFHQPPIGHARGQPVSSRSFRPQEDPPPSASSHPVANLVRDPPRWNRVGATFRLQHRELTPRSASPRKPRSCGSCSRRIRASWSC